MLKKMMPVAAGLMAFMSGSAFADMGLAAGISSDDSAEIRLPIRSQNTIYEPYVSFASISYNSDELFESRKSDDQSFSVGLSVLRVRTLQDSLFWQYGIRAGYLQRDGELSAVYGTNIEQNYQTLYSEEKLSGYLVSPRIGVFYSINDKVNLGIDVGYTYQNLSGDVTEVHVSYYDDEPPETYRDAKEDVDVSQWNSFSLIFMRVYF
ncbi:hypothetical protein [Teredinibacter turnerae]|uniref:hypothetical protein n=1 Tax=Teredinibacter turnerae TaxID=2426 RepID=UPI0030D0E127